MTDDVIDLIRGVNPCPDELPAPLIQPVLRRLEGTDHGRGSQARRSRRPNLGATMGALGVATAVAVAVLAFALLGHTRSRTATPNAASSTTSTAASTTSAPPGQDNLSGTWSGRYSGVYGSGTFTISWQQSRWTETSPGVWHANLNGSIKLSAFAEVLGIRGTVLTNCRQAPCYHGDIIKFRTLRVAPSVLGGTWGWGPERAIVYTGRASAPDMHGSYHTPNGGDINGRGVWSAKRLGQ